MKPADQLTVLEAIALGYALAGKEQQAKIFAMLPASEWVGPLGDIARGVYEGSAVDLSIIGIESYVSRNIFMKEIVDELIVAENEKRRRSMAESVAALAARMNDPRLPGGVPTESEIETILAKARGLYADQRKAKAGGAEQQARSIGTTEVPAAVGQATPKAVRSHQATGASSPKV